MHHLSALRSLALLLLRGGLGAIFIYHGAPKLFGNPQRHMEFFAQLGFHPYLAYLAGVVELFGGAMLVVGLYTRLAGLLLAGQMAVAIWKVHLGKGLFAVDEYQFPLAVALAAFTLATTGAGAISLDMLILREKA